MKAICRYTGLDLGSSSGLARWCCISEHQVFTVPLIDLIEMAAVEWSPEMFILDKKLLLLSIAKNCELITWENTHELTPAMPSPSTVEDSIEHLLQIAGWIDYQRSVNKFSSYPQFRISEETAAMREFPTMLRSIIKGRDITEKQERREHKLVCLEDHARKLRLRQAAGWTKDNVLLTVTANWVMEITAEQLNAEKVTPEIRRDWVRMLTTSPRNVSKIASFLINDVYELRNFMSDYLPPGSVIAHDVHKHIAALIEFNSFTDIDGGVILGARMLTNGALTASATEPRREEYPSIIAYARAKAQWVLVQTQKEETANELAKLNRQLEFQAKRENCNADDI